MVAAAEGFSMAAFVVSLADLVAEVADSVMDLDAISMSRYQLFGCSLC